MPVDIHLDPIRRRERNLLPAVKCNRRNRPGREANHCFVRSILVKHDVRRLLPRRIDPELRPALAAKLGLEFRTLSSLWQKRMVDSVGPRRMHPRISRRDRSIGLRVVVVQTRHSELRIPVAGVLRRSTLRDNPAGEIPERRHEPIPVYRRNESRLRHQHGARTTANHRRGLLRRNEPDREACLLMDEQDLRPVVNHLHPWVRVQKDLCLPAQRVEHVPANVDEVSALRGTDEGQLVRLRLALHGPGLTQPSPWRNLAISDLVRRIA